MEEKYLFSNKEYGYREVLEEVKEVISTIIKINNMAIEEIQSKLAQMGDIQISPKSKASTYFRDLKMVKDKKSEASASKISAIIEQENVGALLVNVEQTRARVQAAEKQLNDVLDSDLSTKEKYISLAVIKDAYEERNNQLMKELKFAQRLINEYENDMESGSSN